LPTTLVSTTAGSVIGVQSATTAQVATAPATEWSSFSARYQQYRVRSITLRLDPVFPGAGNPTAGNTGHIPIYVGEFLAGSTPASVAAVLADERCRIFNSSKVIVYRASWDRFPNAKLWANTTGGPPAANVYAIAWCTSTVTAAPASQAFSYSTLMWEVELRGSQ